MTDEELNVLKGTTLRVYRFLLERNNPTGVREVQRALELSSPSLATYHLTKLEEAGLIKHENGYYVVTRFVFKNLVRINHFLLPKHLFYSIFVIVVLIADLTFFRPMLPTRDYFFNTITILVVVLIFLYETYTTWIETRHDR